jgi:hypothetical protein
VIKHNILLDPILRCFGNVGKWALESERSKCEWLLIKLPHLSDPCFLVGISLEVERKDGPYPSVRRHHHSPCSALGTWRAAQHAAMLPFLGKEVYSIYVCLKF